jgi:hypothetical protein
MTQAKGSSVQFMLVEEAAWGSAPATPAGYVIPVSGLSGDWGSRNLIDNPTLRANRNPFAPARGNTVVNGSFGFPLTLSAWGWIQKHAVGVPATSGTASPYTHLSKCDFSGSTAGSDLPIGITFEIGHTGIAQYHYFTGCKLNGFSVTGASEGIAVFNVDVIGQDFNQDTSSLDASPTSYTDGAIDHFSLAMSEGGGAITNVKECSLNFTNNLDSSQFVISGSGGQLGALPTGVAMVSGSITALFENDTLLTKARNFTESDLTMTWTSGTSSLALHVPEMVYSVRHPQVSGPDGVVISLDYRGYYANDADATCLKATLVNTVAAYS